MIAKWFGLMLTRPLLILGTQAVLSIVLGSWRATLPWWPFQLIVANGICGVVLFQLIRQDDKSLRDVYLGPRSRDPPFPGIERLVAPQWSRHRGSRVASDAGLFLGLLLGLALPTIAFAKAMESRAVATADVVRYAPLPLWALVSITVLLPLTMPLVEVPWYFGLFLPKLEEAQDRKKRGSTAFALLATTITYSIQHCFQPLVLNTSFVALRSVMLLPTLTLTGLIVRIIPRFMPWILLLHALLAIEVVARLWSAS